MPKITKQEYIALTIGPIGQTLERVKSTRALFASSYIFSYIMREILRFMVNKDATFRNRIVLPALDSLKDTGKPEVGFYPDQMIMEAGNNDFEHLKAARQHVLQSIADDISKDGNTISVSYLSQYFQIYIFKAAFEQNETVIDEISKVLHTLEMRRTFPDVETDDLTQFLIKKKASFLTRDAFKEQRRFPSLIEIATKELKVLNGAKYREIIKTHIWNKTAPSNTDIKDEELVIKAFKQGVFKDNFKAYHKYIAIVHADGDKVGAYIKSLKGESKELRKFSAKLHEFGKAARDKIKAYGGAPVYIGGDDLLFFAPVANQIKDNEDNLQLQSIFHLIKDLDVIFHDYFPKSEGSPTMSYGISITYYKHPMNEARTLSYEMLEEAKNACKHVDKNAIAFQLAKHSGNFFGAVFEKSKTASYQAFLALLSTSIKGENTQFINSITHILDYHRNIINELMSLPKETGKRKERLKYYFDNNFNEQIHKENADFIDKIIALTWDLYQDYPLPVFDLDNEKKGQQPLDKLYAILRFIHFLKSKEQ